jgi:hypothetical protein
MTPRENGAASIPRVLVVESCSLEAAREREEEGSLRYLTSLPTERCVACLQTCRALSQPSPAASSSPSVLLHSPRLLPPPSSPAPLVPQHNCGTMASSTSIDPQLLMNPPPQQEQPSEQPAGEEILTVGSFSLSLLFLTSELTALRLQSIYSTAYPSRTTSKCRSGRRGSRRGYDFVKCVPSFLSCTRNSSVLTPCSL